MSRRKSQRSNGNGRVEIGIPLDPEVVGSLVYHVEVRLTVRQAKILARMFRGVLGNTLNNGFEVTSRPRAIQWLLEEIERREVSDFPKSD